MTNELYQRMDEIVRVNAELTLQLEVAQAQIESLKLTIDLLKNKHSAVTEELEEAKGEIARLDMVRKRNQDSLEMIKQHGRRS